MERRTLLERLSWQRGEVVAIRQETARAKSITLAVNGWPGHRAGQHVDVRLTAEDGYQAERSYSIASAPEEGQQVTLTVERLNDGEVSPYLVDELCVGDAVELRGPIGGYFIWETQMGGPLLLVAGGSGIVPLMAMLRHRVAVASTVPTCLIYSSQSEGEMIYRDELDCLTQSTPGLDVIYILTREQPPGWTGYRRRIDAQMLREVAWPPGQNPFVFVCGPTSFVEIVSSHLVTLGYEATRIRTERFGATGGA